MALRWLTKFISFACESIYISSVRAAGILEAVLTYFFVFVIIGHQLEKAMSDSEIKEFVVQYGHPSNKFTDSLISKEFLAHCLELDCGVEGGFAAGVWINMISYEMGFGLF